MKHTRSPFFFLFFFILATASLSVQAQEAPVILVEITGTIDQSTVEYLKGSFQNAEQLNAQAVLLLLNTPGGGLQETQDIAYLIQESEIPVIGYVYPTGSTAWSAGTFILLSTHLAAMANHTIIGSCQPVVITLEGTQTVNDSKTINALVEWIQERARMYGRNESLAEEFIRINRNVNATSAQKYGVIEVVAPTIDALLRQIDGWNVTTAAGNVVLRTAEAEQIFSTPSLSVQLLKLFSNPILTSLLFMLGIFSLLFGISAPGYGAEVFGVIAILLALIGSGFGISTLSIIFIIIGCLLLIIELFATPGFGVIGIGGVICLVVGSIFLVPSYAPPTSEWMISMDWIQDAIVILLAMAILIALFFVFLVYKIIEIRGKKKAVGVFIGEQAITIDRITPDTSGYVRFKGEYWQAKADTIIEPGTKVLIVAKEESTLMVKPKNA
jgi:membrane-bound serine protease (ClpP class)